MNWKKLTGIIALGFGVSVAHAAGNVTIRLIELNDLHAHLTPHKELVEDGMGGSRIEMRGGLTRISTLVKQLRSENPDSILMNIGDTYHGGVEAFYSMGNSIVGPVNALGVDVGVPGNWDFYYTPAVTRMRYGRVDTAFFEIPMPGFDEPIPVKQPNFPNLGANVTDLTDFFPGGQNDFLPPTHMIEKSGVKIGFIGLTSDIVENMHPMLAQGMDFAKGETEHRDIINRYANRLRRQGADVIVVMSELGSHKDKRLADTVDPGITAFFSAHTHDAIFTPVMSDSGAVLVQSGSDAYLGRMDITVRKTRRSAKVTGLDWKLINVDNSIAEDPEMKALVDAERAPYLEDGVFMLAPPFMIQTLTQPIDTVIGQTASLMSRKDAVESSFNVGWTGMLRQMTGTDIAMSPGFRMGSTIGEPGYTYEDGAIADGAVTVEDAYRFFPMFYGITTAEVTGQRLYEISEKILASVFSSEPFNHTGGWNFGFAGLDITLDLTAGDGRRVKSIRYADTGVPVMPGDTLTVTGCRRMPIDFPGKLCAIDGFTNIAPIALNPLKGIPWTAVDTFIMLMSQNTFDGAHRHTTLNTDVPRWPETEFVQPLEGSGGNAAPAQDSDDCGFFKYSCSNGGTTNDGNAGGFFGFF